MQTTGRSLSGAPTLTMCEREERHDMDKQEANEYVVNSNDCVQARRDGANTIDVYRQKSIGELC